MKQKHLEPGDYLDERYRIVRPLAAGGMAIVHLAVDTRLEDKPRAIKEWMANDIPVTLMDELRMLCRLEHAALPQVIDYYPADDGHGACLVMEYIEGQTLEQWLTSQGVAASEEAVAQIADQLLSCLQYLHAQTPPVIYRDLKPANIMILPSGEVKLIDFGIARLFRREQLQDTQALGTLTFVSPEQLAGRQTDARSDLYSLGGVLYYLLTGGKLYNELRTPLIDRWGRTSDLQQLVNGLLQDRPNERFQSASEAREALRSFEGKVHGRGRTSSPTDTHSTDERIQGNRINRWNSGRLIVIGGLSAGSGSTYAAVSLSCVLARLKIPHALAEFPGNTASLRWLGECASVAMNRWTYGTGSPERSATGCEEMMQAPSMWHMLDSEMPSDWSYEQVKRYFNRLPEQHLLIIDVSHRWMDQEVQQLCRDAEQILIVADPYPPAFNSLQARQHMTQFHNWQQQGKSVQWIANRVHANKKSVDWLACLPNKPLVCLPPADGQALFDSYRQGEVYQSYVPIVAEHRRYWHVALPIVTHLPRQQERRWKWKW